MIPAGAARVTARVESAGGCRTTRVESQVRSLPVDAVRPGGFLASTDARKTLEEHAATYAARRVERYAWTGCAVVAPGFAMASGLPGPAPGVGVGGGRERYAAVAAI